MGKIGRARVERATGDGESAKKAISFTVAFVENEEGLKKSTRTIQKKSRFF